MELSFYDNGGALFPLQVLEYTPNYKINYMHVEGSNGKHLSVDRGTKSDRYATTVICHGTREYIEDLTNKLYALRNAKKLVKLTGIADSLFGDMVDHSGDIDCYVGTLEMTEDSPKLNVKTVRITLLTDKSTLVFHSATALPPLCLTDSYKSWSPQSTRINETYTRDVYFVDRENDSYYFEGAYTMSQEDCRKLLTYWREIIRGNAFVANESLFTAGLPMFGGVLKDTVSHEVVVVDISYKILTPILREVTIRLKRDA
jgi:hypothetical protein